MNKFKNFLDNFKKLDLKNLQNFSLICFIILGLSIVKDYSISYDEQEYRQQGFIVLNHLGQKFIPEKVKEISETRSQLCRR